MTKKAQLSILSILKSSNKDITEWPCVHPWPDNCHCQAGHNGIVVTKSGHYRTAFFEAFPKYPETFIRGEGPTIEAAEEAAWSKYGKYLDCPEHVFERRGYTNGAGFCKHCGMFISNAFKPEMK